MKVVTIKGVVQLSPASLRRISEHERRLDELIGPAMRKKLAKAEDRAFLHGTGKPPA